VHIVDLSSDDPAAIEQTASLLLEAFRSQTPSWPDMASALDEVHESFAVNRLSRVAREADGTVVGWIGGIQIYTIGNTRESVARYCRIWRIRHASEVA
jgi:hypothetical protein